MGRVSDWVIEMQEDAVQMSLSEFISKHGYSKQNCGMRLTLVMIGI